MAKKSYANFRTGGDYWGKNGGYAPMDRFRRVHGLFDCRGSPELLTFNLLIIR